MKKKKPRIDKSQTACAVNGSMKDYCLKCRKFCLYFIGDYKLNFAYCVDIDPKRFYNGRVEGRCYYMCNDSEDDVSRKPFYEFAKLPNNYEKRGSVRLSGELMQRLRICTSFSYIMPKRLTYYFDSPVEEIEGEKFDRIENIDDFLEAKREFVEICDKYLRKTRCPLEPEDRNCDYYVERVMKSWNRKE